MQNHAVHFRCQGTPSDGSETLDFSYTGGADKRIIARGPGTKEGQCVVAHNGLHPIIRPCDDPNLDAQYLQWEFRNGMLTTAGGEKCLVTFKGTDEYNAHFSGTLHYGLTIRDCTCISKAWIGCEQPQGECVSQRERVRFNI